MNWRLKLYYASLPNRPPCSGMPFDEVDAIDQYLLFLGMGKAHLTRFTLILTGNNQYRIVFPNLHGLFPYKTSGARDIILVKFFSLNSLATGPNIRLPLGLFLSVRITAAFSSNLM
jgi:hypothetical protein